MEKDVPFEYAINYLAQLPYVKGINHRRMGAEVDPLPIADVKIDIMQIQLIEFVGLINFKKTIKDGTINLIF